MNSKNILDHDRIVESEQDVGGELLESKHHEVNIDQILGALFVL
jgi:hypothetical protein